jgi:uncharacterized protein YeaC (DUF1315 family)
MELDELIGQMTPEVHKNLRRAVEVGKWSDGTPLSQQQKEHSLEAVIAYEEKHMSEQDKVGYIDRGKKAKTDVCDDPQPLKLPE